MRLHEKKVFIYIFDVYAYKHVFKYMKERKEESSG